MSEQTAEDIPTKQIQLRHPGGRPSKYNAELLRKGWDYLETWQEYGHKIPTLAALALILDIREETVQAWKNDKNKAEFSKLCERLMLVQRQTLLDNGLDSTYNSNITKLVLGNGHGMHDNPQSNQGSGGIQVIVNRDKVTLKHRGETLEIEGDSD